MNSTRTQRGSFAAAFLAISLMCSWAKAEDVDVVQQARALYTQGERAYEAGDNGLAAIAFAKADAMVPAIAALEAALLSVVRTNNAALGMELAERSLRVTDSPQLAQLATRVRNRFSSEPAATRPLPDLTQPSPDVVSPTPDPASASSARRDDATRTTAGGLDPTWFWVGVAATGASLVGAVVSGLDTVAQHAEFSEMPSAERAEAGQDAELRTNVLLGVTGGLAAVTLLVGLVGVKWDADAQVARRVTVGLTAGAGLPGVRFDF